MRNNKIQINQIYGKPVSKPAKTNGVSGAQSSVSDTQFIFATTHSPLGQKTSLVNFKHKITTSANYTDGIGTGYTSHEKEICLHGKRLKIQLQNQSIKLDLY